MCTHVLRFEQKSVTNLFVSSVSYHIYRCEKNQYIVKVAYCKLFWSHIIEKIYYRYLSLVVRKLVFGVSDQVRHKPSCTATEDSLRLDILNLCIRGIIQSV